MTSKQSSGLWDTLSSFIVHFVLKSDLNRLPPEFGGEPFTETPLIGVADGYDSIFSFYKELISPDYITPQELWNFTVDNARKQENPTDDQLRVISIVFPFSNAIRSENSRAKDFPSESYSVARNYANALIYGTLKAVIAFLEQEGYKGAAGAMSDKFNITIKNVMFSNWSERHVAFAAGLGTFSLHEGLITAVGCNVRLGSIVTNAPLPVTSRRSDEPYANCLFYANGSCGKCIERCPAGAITKHGHDKFKCWMYGQKVERHMRKRIGHLLKPHHRRINGYYSPVKPPVGCALCQFGVPCTATNPIKESPSRKP